MLKAQNSDLLEPFKKLRLPLPLSSSLNVLDVGKQMGIIWFESNLPLSSTVRPETFQDNMKIVQGCDISIPISPNVCEFESITKERSQKCFYMPNFASIGHSILFVEQEGSK